MQCCGVWVRTMRRRTIVKITFMSCCLLLFLYKTYEVFDSWQKNEIVTKIYHDKQENLPMPLICLSTRNRRFYIRNSEDENGVGNTSSSISVSGETLTYKAYTKGAWNTRNSSSNLTAEELYDKITPNLSDLVYRISVQKTAASIGDSYTLHNYTELQNLTWLDEEGMKVERSDYYPYLKCYCINLTKSKFPHGVQGIYIYPKIEIAVLIVPPGRFYDYSRKLSSFELQLNYTHHYVIQYGIYKLLDLKSSNKSCSEKLSWREDECKLEKMTNTVLSINHCTAPWFLYHARKHNLDYEICSEKSSSKNTSEEFYNRRYEPYPECENPCQKMIITTLFNSKSPGKQELQIRFARQIQITEEDLKVTLLEALANIGGYLGMILGISILDVEKVAAFLLTFLHREDNERQEYVVEGPHNIPHVLEGRDNLAVDPVQSESNSISGEKMPRNFQEITTKVWPVSSKQSQTDRIAATLYKTL